MNPETSVTNTSSVFIIWQDQVSNSKLNDILSRNSTDGGASFGDTINLSNPNDNSTDPDIASSNDGRVFAVWSNDANGKTSILHITDVSFCKNWFDPYEDLFITFSITI